MLGTILLVGLLIPTARSSVSLMNVVIQTIGAFVAQTYATRRKAMTASAKDYALARADYYGTRRTSSRDDDSALDGRKTMDRPP